MKPGTRELIDILQAKRLMKHDGMHFLYKGTPMEFSPVDAIVCWGAHVPAPVKTPCLNAHLKYNSLLGLNVRGLTALNALGYTVLLPHEMPGAAYIANLCKTEWPTKAPAGNQVSLPEFDGYGTAYYKFDHRDDVAVFQGKLLNDVKHTALSSAAMKVLSQLGLDFGVMSMGSINGTVVTYKIQTGPALDAAGVKIFAKHIAIWAKSVGEFNATAGKFEELLK